jgi:hypothetical protein
MSEQSPAPGDLLVSRRLSDDHFEISIVPGRPQLAIRQQHEALKQAHAFAAQNGGKVWMLQGGTYIRMAPPAAKRTES